MRELRSNLDVASSTEGITRSSVNYLCHSMSGSKFTKKSLMKREY